MDILNSKAQAYAGPQIFNTSHESHEFTRMKKAIRHAIRGNS